MAGTAWDTKADCVRHPYGAVLRDDHATCFRHWLRRGLCDRGDIDVCHDGLARTSVESTGAQRTYRVGSRRSVCTHCYGGRGSGGCEARACRLRLTEKDEAYPRIRCTPSADAAA